MQKKYRAKISLNTKKGLIRPKDIVPEDYPLLDMAIKKGWVEEILVDERTGKQYAEVLSDKEIKPVEKLADTPKPETESDPPIEPESTPTQPVFKSSGYTMETKIADLVFLNPGQIRQLEKAEIATIVDLAGMESSELCMIDGIGQSTANKLVSVYNRVVSGK
jgi:hypothetical protein